MRYTKRLIFVLLLIANIVSAQFRKQPYYMQLYGLKPDSLLILPQILTNPSLLTTGGFRYNGTTGYAQLYKSSAWTDIAFVTDLGSYTPTSRTLNVASGTDISVTGGTQSLAANRTWTVNNTSTWGSVMGRGATSTTNGVVNATINSDYAFRFNNAGTTGAGGIYVNTASGSTGDILRVEKNLVPNFVINGMGRILVDNATDDGTNVINSIGGIRSSTAIVAYNGTGGQVALIPGSPGGAGFMEIYNSSLVRLGFIGSLSTDMYYKSEGSGNHLFDGGNVGVKTTPASTLQVGGSFATAVVTVTGNTTLNATHQTIVVNNSGTATLTLPLAATCSGRIYTVKKVSGGGNNVIISAAGSDTIDGSSTKNLTLLYSAASIQSDGVGWIIRSSYAASVTL